MIGWEAIKNRLDMSYMGKVLMLIWGRARNIDQLKASTISTSRDVQ